MHLDEHRLDDAYFKALEEVLEQRDQPYVASYRIWLYELPWASKNVTRLGYLFMGAPNERSTAQPPRDFYVYFLQPYDPPAFVDEERGDETFIRLAAPDDDFTAALRRYAGADALAVESTEQHRVVYEEKRRAALKAMVDWLRQNMAAALTVTYRGKTKPLGIWLQQVPGAKTTVKGQIDAIAAAALTPHFEARYPGYPAFTAQITRQTFEATVQQAIAQITTRRTTTLGTKVLASLGLIDMDGAVVTDGPYAKDLLDRLAASGGQAVNRGALLRERDPDVWTWGPWHLEPAWLVVVAAALCQVGRLELGFQSGQIDALGLEKLPRMSLDELERISHLAHPKALPVVALREVASLLGLAPGAIPESGPNEAIVQQILTAAQAMLDRVVAAEQDVAVGIQLWGALVVDRQAERGARLTALKSLLENIKARNSVGKMNKIALDDGALAAAKEGWRALVWVETAQKARNRLSAAIEYVNVASAALGESDPLADDAQALREEVLALFRANTIDPAAVTSTHGAAEQLRQRYREAAAQAHRRDRLDAAGEKRKREILESDTYHDLGRLSAVELLPSGNFASLQRRLLDVQSCPAFDEHRLDAQVRCPDCNYEPKASEGPTARARVEQIADDLLKLRTEWQASLRDSLREEQLAVNIEYLKSERERIQAFAASGELPSPIDAAFVQALNQVLRGFEVRKISKAELFGAIFPESGPATVGTLEERFRGFLDTLRDGADQEKLRVVPASEEPLS